MQKLTLALAFFTAAMLSAADTPWHIDSGKSREFVRIMATGTSGGGSTIVFGSGPEEANGRLRAWSVTENREVPAQRLGSGTIAVVLGKPPMADAETRLFLYEGCEPAASAPLISVDTGNSRVETPSYRAEVDSGRGGLISSLKLKINGGLAETLGKGVRWWHGRDPMVTVESIGNVTVERAAAGPVAVVLRVRYPGFPTKGCAMTATYTFLPDYVDVDYDVEVSQPTTLDWLKFPVDLHGGGATPGFYSNSATTDTALATSGKNRWVPDRLWHDVSCMGKQPYGLGVIARDVPSTLFFMDSGQPTENEWVYAEPVNWKGGQETTAGFTVRLRLVPHAAGKGQWQETVRRLPGNVSASVSRSQRRGDPPIDSDQDGLTDLDELELQTNPSAADTDLDGTPDADDAEPLCGAAPSKVLFKPDFPQVRSSQPDCVARVKPVKGVPTLVVDGKPYGPMMLTRCAASYEQLRDYGDRNHVLHFEMVGPVGWPGEQMNTFRRLDQRINRFLNEIPNARIILRLYLCNPPRFAVDYPDETMRFNDGRIDHYTKWYAMRDRPLEERGYPSFASEVWREKTSEALHNYVNHVRNSAYARNVMGYFICGGGTEEWYYWGDYNHAKLAVDYSPAMLRAFRDHLRRRYDGDVRKLREAWSDASADFATALPPGPEARRRTDWGVFYDPGTQQQVRDYYYVHNKVMEDSLLIFARTVKRACRGRQLVGMFHGYLQNHWLLEGGQATLQELLASPDVDFWSGPPQYNRRGQGEHACNRFPGASLQAHGKLWISESDMRTCFSSVSGHNPSFNGRAPDLQATIGVLTREFAHQLCLGANGWWFPMGADWYSHKPIMDLFEDFQRVGETAVQLDRRTETDVATVVDLDSLLTGPPWPISTSLLDAFKVQELCRLGTPVDHYLLDDILARSTKRYKLIIMLNVFNLNNVERKLIDKRLRRAGTTIVWMYTPGLFNPDATPELSLDHVSQLLGYDVTNETGSDLHCTMQLTPAGAAAFPGFPADRVFGSFERPEWRVDKAGKPLRKEPRPAAYRQRFAAGTNAGSAVDVLARFTENKAPSIVRSRHGEACEYWIGSVMAPADLLRAIAREAGCHLYCDADDIVYANRSFLALHAAESGERTFRLRRKSDVIDVFSGDVVARDADTFALSIPAFDTRLLYIGKRKNWARAQHKADAFQAAFQQELREVREARAASGATSSIEPAKPADPAKAYSLTKDGMVTSFLVCGPFPNRDPKDPACGFDRDFLGGEQTIRPRAGIAYDAVFEAAEGSLEATVWFAGKSGRDETRPAWLPVVVSMDTPMLAEQFPKLPRTERVAYYVACYVDLDAAQRVRVGIGSDDGFKLWVNGSFLGGLNCSRGNGVDLNRHPVDMQAGRNIVLLKVLQGGGPTGWSLRLTTPEGAPLSNCRIALQP